MARLTVSGAELRPGDVILHPVPGEQLGERIFVGTWREVYEVVEQPSVSPGAWSLRCRVTEVASGAAREIAVGPTVQFNIERKE